MRKICLSKNYEEEQETSDDYKQQLRQKTLDIQKDRKLLDKLNRRLGELEQLNDSLEIEKTAGDRSTLVQKNQLNDQIRIISEALSSEKIMQGKNG
jgi:hypothetical protein